MKRRRSRPKSWNLAHDRQDLEPSVRNIRPVSMNSVRSSLHPTRYHPPKRSLPPHKKPVTTVAAEQYGRLFLAACLMLALIAPIFLLAGAFAYFQLTPRVVPGVYSGDIRLGGLTVDQAAIRIHRSKSIEVDQRSSKPPTASITLFLVSAACIGHRQACTTASILSHWL